MGAAARRTDPSTSWEAARSVNVTDNQRDVLTLFRRHGDMTDARLAAVANGSVDQSESGLRTRRKELTVAGKLRNTGRKERLPSGRWAIVWGLP